MSKCFLAMSRTSGYEAGSRRPSDVVSKPTLEHLGTVSIKEVKRSKKRREAKAELEFETEKHEDSDESLEYPPHAIVAPPRLIPTSRRVGRPKRSSATPANATRITQRLCA